VVSLTKGYLNDLTVFDSKNMKILCVSRVYGWQTLVTPSVLPFSAFSVKCFEMISLKAGYLNDLTIFDPKNLSTINVTKISGAPPSARGGHGFTSIGDAIYLHGGLGDGKCIFWDCEGGHGNSKKKRFFYNN
jgi:hypothetical protein